MNLKEQRAMNIIIVDDEEPLRNLFCRRFARNGIRVFEAGDAEAALALARKESFDVGILDIMLPGMDGVELFKKLKKLQPGMEVVIISGQASVETAIEAMKLGAYDYLTKPCKLSELEMVVQKAYEKRNLQRQNELLKEELKRKEKEAYPQIIGNSARIQAIKTIIDKVADSHCPVLIEGESGTGKELVAHAIHRESPRATNPFIAINCGALPENLLESELFGHVRGAFTGAAKDKRGLFEVADTGTFFIDEIGEMSPGMQVKLLRVLETGVFRPVGSVREIKVDVRIVAATNRNLGEEVKRGNFREDLYYRLNVMNIVLPPLRERKDDIPLLVRYFLDKMRQERGVRKEVSGEAMEALLAYHWPGNVRELANVIERGTILSAGSQIRLADLPLAVATRTPSPPANGNHKTLAEVEREHIRRILAAEGANKTRAARTLGISLRTLYRKLEKYSLSPEQPD